MADGKPIDPRILKLLRTMINVAMAHNRLATLAIGTNHTWEDAGMPDFLPRGRERLVESAPLYAPQLVFFFDQRDPLFYDTLVAACWTMSKYCFQREGLQTAIFTAIQMLRDLGIKYPENDPGFEPRLAELLQQTLDAVGVTEKEQRMDAFVAFWKKNCPCA